jgi:fumarylacetoacetase
MPWKSMTENTTDPGLNNMTNSDCWIPVPEESHFSIHNLPFGIFSVGSNQRRLGVAIGNQIVDLTVVADLGLFDTLGIDKQVFHEETLNGFIGLGKVVTSKVRLEVQKWLTTPESPLKDHNYILVEQQEASMHMPLEIGDYTDFYSSLEHATNVGKMFRDPENALLPNWKHIPVGYHGRVSSIVESGVPIHRPSGQIMPKNATNPVFTASQRLDFELEMAFVIGKENRLGQPISAANAEEYIFGMVLFNDWSARDIQKWEYVPLGPFLGKNFGSSISPWIVTMEALEPFRTQGPVQDPAVLPYLQTIGPQNFDIDLEVVLTPLDGTENTICRSNFRYMYWNMAQQLAHHTVNGCNVRVGDLLASGTISGPDPSSFGSLLELSWGGTKPLTLKNGSVRTFIEDYDTVTMRGWAGKSREKVGFGEVSTKILPTLHE